MILCKHYLSVNKESLYVECEVCRDEEADRRVTEQCETWSRNEEETRHDKELQRLPEVVREILQHQKQNQKQ